MIPIRKGQAPAMLDRQAFHERFMQSFYDPAFDAEKPAIARLEAIAWDAYQQGRKAPRTQPAGPGHADPTYALSDEWRATRDALRAAQAEWARPGSPSRALVVCCASRNDGSCPGEMSKTFRLARMAGEVLQQASIEVELLDLSRLTSDYDRHIHPCKGCASTAMPLCHWPCSCYPNHDLRQTGDWMAEIYESWVRAHGVLLVTPVYWYQAASPLKLMMDRLVCADGGNPDPTSTHGKKPEEAKALEMAGWDYPKHLAGRAYGVFVHGDVAGVEPVRRALCDWLDWMGLVDAGFQARLDRYIGYWQPYADSHETLDRDTAVQEEMRNVARALAVAIGEQRAGRLRPPDAGLSRPRPK
ncbi:MULTISPECIES: flavodoxin family protein [Ramlibacter]|uniref:Flavodoxin family protein n=1 Tax=Ramlibacter aquaticus TaxID=2780094 RepID=A0ABR9SIY6_9BURK|nr:MULTISPECIES: flavodoxin family protein [Ramlibacter]MBE7942297.1 flavodoxin family protein [Ramlibacter aquaticus]